MNHWVCFPMICGTGRSKSRVGKAAGAEPARREAHSKVKMYKTHHPRTTCGSHQVEKAYAEVAPTRIQVKMYKALQCWNAFWKLEGLWQLQKRWQR